MHAIQDYMCTHHSILSVLPGNHVVLITTYDIQRQTLLNIPCLHFDREPQSQTPYRSYHFEDIDVTEK